MHYVLQLFDNFIDVYLFFKILHGGNVTKSVLHFHPRPSDHGKTLTCRAENTELSHAAIEDHWKLTIHCKISKVLSVKEYC